MTQWRRLWVAVLAIVVCGSSSFVRADSASDDEYYELMKVFVDTFEQIDRNYVTQVDRRELVEAAMRGMIIKLDPYSQYIDSHEIKNFNEHVEQEFGGVGIQVTFDQHFRQLVVTMPLPGTPAFRAGVRQGDRIVEIDDKPTNEFPENREMEMAITMIKGKPGTVVKLKVLHTGSEAPETIEITRATIKSPTVQGDHHDAKGESVFFVDEKEKIAYIRLTSFGRNSAEEMKEALVKLTKEGLRGLILDLRFNPGGLLTAATAIADDFISEGVIVSTKGRNKEENVVHAKRSGTFTGFPMVVLVNRYSASASEIVSACLQDHKRAIIVGERTWGKGSVQNVIELEGGKSAIKLTTASFHRPSGKNLHRFPKSTEKDEWGVIPDEGFNIRLSDKEMQELGRRIDREKPAAPKEGANAEPEFVDKQYQAGLDAVKKMLAEGKTYLEKEAKPDTDAKAPEAKKDNGTSMIIPMSSGSFADAILEFWRVWPQMRAATL